MLNNSSEHVHMRMKHNPKSFESFERNNKSSSSSSSSSSKSKSLRGSIRRTLSLAPQSGEMSPTGECVTGSTSVTNAAAAAINGNQFNCTCALHTGKEFINKIFNLDINYMFECLFEKSDFDSRFSQVTKKFGKR